MKSETDTNKNMILLQERLKELRGNNKLQDIAKDIGISRASLGYYENGDRKPDIEVLLKLANYYHVSCDYLLGLTDIKSPDINTRAISEKLGLTPKSIETLSTFQHNATRDPIPGNINDTTPAYSKLDLETINRLLSPFCNIIDNITNYIYLNFDSFYNDENYRDEKLYHHISELGLFDKRLGIGYSEDYDYLSQVFLLMVQKELIQLREETQLRILERTTPVTSASDNDPDVEID